MIIIQEEIYLNPEIKEPFLKHADFHAKGTVGLQAIHGYAIRGFVTQEINNQGTPVTNQEGWLKFLISYHVNKLEDFSTYLATEAKNRPEKIEFFKRHGDKIKTQPIRIFNTLLINERPLK